MWLERRVGVVSFRCRWTALFVDADSESVHRLASSLSVSSRWPQEKELKVFRDGLRAEARLMKQDVERLPRSERKEALRSRREKLESQQQVTD